MASLHFLTRFEASGALPSLASLIHHHLEEGFRTKDVRQPQSIQKCTLPTDDRPIGNDSMEIRKTSEGSLHGHPLQSRCESSTENLSTSNASNSGFLALRFLLRQEDKTSRLSNIQFLVEHKETQTKALTRHEVLPIQSPVSHVLEQKSPIQSQEMVDIQSTSIQKSSSTMKGASETVDFSPAKVECVSRKRPVSAHGARESTGRLGSTKPTSLNATRSLQTAAILYGQSPYCLPVHTPCRTAGPSPTCGIPIAGGSAAAAIRRTRARNAPVIRGESEALRLAGCKPAVDGSAHHDEPVVSPVSRGETRFVDRWMERLYGLGRSASPADFPVLGQRPPPVGEFISSMESNVPKNQSPVPSCMTGHREGTTPFSPPTSALHGQAPNPRFHLSRPGVSRIQIGRTHTSVCRPFQGSSSSMPSPASAALPSARSVSSGNRQVAGIPAITGCYNMYLTKQRRTSNPRPLSVHQRVSAAKRAAASSSLYYADPSARPSLGPHAALASDRGSESAAKVETFDDNLVPL